MNKKDEEVEIDLLELAKKLWFNKKFILKSGLLGVVIGLIIAFSIPKEYTTSIIIATESQKSMGSNNMGALASLAGISLSQSSGDIFSPDIYPEVLNSTPFLQELLKIRVLDTTQNIDTNLYEYLKNGQKKAWWNYILQIPEWFAPDDTSLDNNNTSADRYFITKEEFLVFNHLKKMYVIDTDKKTNLTTLKVTSQSPKVVALLADTIISYLQNYIINQRTKKAKMDLYNSELLFEQAKNNYYKSQQNLALFIDGNKNVISEKYKIKQDRLKNEVDLSYTVYNQMAQQVQMNRIKVQDDTPVFTVIQPAIEPLYASKPNKVMIVLVLFVLASLGASIYTIRKDILF